MKRVPWTVAGLSLLLAALVLPAAQPARKLSEAELRAQSETLARRTERLLRELQNDAIKENRLNRALQDADRSVSRASGDLTALRTQRNQRAAARQELVAERARRQSEREATEADLASQLRAAYFMGRNEPLKLLLNQRNPAEFGRNLTYYGYLGRLRASQISVIRGNIARIDELTVRIDAEDAELARLEARQKGLVADLESARRQQGRVLANQKQESRERATELKNARAQRQELEKLLKEIARATQALPYEPNGPFEKAKKRLSWPVAGRIAVNFGATIAGGQKSEGIEISADRGREVRAVHEGRVVFSDYMSGRGYLVIVDHDNGYLSLYMHNEALFKAVGARVAAGDKIATAGDSGGAKSSGLYFEIRRSGKPVDPRPWFRTDAPPTG